MSIVAFRSAVLLTLAVAGMAAIGDTRAEIVEEIVAWVNGDIITKSEYDAEEEARVSDVYRRFAGEELDSELERVRKDLLLRLIDRKILVDRAERLYDLEKMADSFYQSFKAQQGVEDDQEFERLLAQEGLSVADIKQQLVNLYAPDEVIRFEVRGRLGVSEREVQEFYDENPEQFLVAAEVTVREIVLRADSEASVAARRAEAEAIRNRAVGGEDFAELARAVSEAGTRESGGLLESMKKADLSDRLSEVAFEIAVGSVSEVIEMPYGLHLIKVESRLEAQSKPLEEVREPVREFLQQRMFAEELETFLEKARAEAEWCVKPRHQDLLSSPSPPSCEFF